MIPAKYVRARLGHELEECGRAWKDGEFIRLEFDDEPDFIVPHPTFRPGDRVRIKHALHRGQTGEIQRYFPATENYLVAIDGMPDKIILTDEQMEAV